MKKRPVIYMLVLALMLTMFTGCQQKSTDIETILPKAQVINAGVSFLNVSVGQNIPQLSYEPTATEFTQLCDAVYAAASVTVEIPVSYSPELNASHEIALVTENGTMAVYYDDFQNILNIPINRKVNDETVRVYMSFQPTGLTELLNAWQATLPEPEPIEPPVDPNQFPPDDTQLRATIDPELFSQASTEITSEPASYVREQDGAVYYVFSHDDKEELPENKLMMVAVPEAGEIRQVSIASIVENDYYIIATVALADVLEGAQLTDAAVLCERADLEKGKPIVFINEQGEILYAQNLVITPLSAQDPAIPTDDPSEPSNAAGGQVGDDEPLQP